MKKKGDHGIYLLIFFILVIGILLIFVLDAIISLF